MLVSLGSVAMPATPAQAHGFVFEFHRDQFVFGRPHLRFPRLCLTDYQLRRAIREQGYHDIYLNVPNNNRIQVRATRGDWVYLLRVNSCTGKILRRERLRPS